MTLHKGDHVIFTRGVHLYKSGTRAVVILIDGNRYNVLLKDGIVLEELTEDDLFAVDDDGDNA